MKSQNIVQIVNGIKTETKLLAVSLVIILLLGGCTPTTPPNNNNGWGDIPSEYTIEGIPNVKQVALSTDFSVAAEMAFKSLGVDVDWVELIPIIQYGTYKDIVALELYAEDNGFNSGSYNIDLGDALTLTSMGVRMVAQTKYAPESQSILCRVPFGYKIEEKEIYLKDPWIGGDVTISFDDFPDYSNGYGVLGNWTAVLIYDKNISIDDLNLIPYSYPTI